jgi:hypothetical protein
MEKRHAYLPYRCEKCGEPFEHSEHLAEHETARRDRQYYYGIPTEANARLWAKRTPSEFVFKAYRLFTRHQTPERGLAGSRYAGHNDEIAQWQVERKGSSGCSAGRHG